MLEHFTEALNNFVQELVSQYKSNLISNGHEATGNLVNSVSFDVEIHDDSYEITLELADYWKYVEDGRSPGKFPPPDAILNWIHVKNILPHEINGKLPSEQSLAFLIGRKIANEGIQGTHDLAEAKDEIIAKYESIIAEAIEKDYNETSIELFKQSLFFEL